MGRLPNVDSMLAHRLRRWPNIELTLGKRPVFAGHRLFRSTSLTSISQMNNLIFYLVNIYKNKYKHIE